ELHRKDICHLVFGSPLLIVLCVYLLSKSRSRVTGYASQMLGITSAILATFNLFLVVTAHSVTTRVGPVAIFKDDPTLAFLNAHATEGEDIFVYPYRPMYYFLSSTSNPTRYSLLMYSYNTDSQFYDAIRSLEERKPRYVVWDVSFETKARDYFPTSDRRGTADLIIEPYLESHYHLVTENDGYRIMERKEDQPAN
ncbi:MAG: hypothetical protein ABSD44_13930, partial [Terracidiphilus sp.]